MTSYTLVFAGFLLLAGRLADLYGHRRVFSAGLVVFATARGSVGCWSNPATDDTVDA